ncbi:MAG: LPS export ABC transporter periplasmic protein LptC [bacterium]|nr:LPS export ABC transporter periplasmic protein LptC [bacterium]
MKILLILSILGCKTVETTKDNIKYELLNSTTTFETYKIYSKRMIFYEDGSFSSQEPIFETSDFRLYAKTSYSKDPTKEIFFLDEVEINTGKMKILGSKFVYKVKDGTIYSNKAVKIIDENKVITADEIMSDSKFKNIKLKNESIFVFY